MSEAHGARPLVVVVSSRWDRGDEEQTVALRGVAAGISRTWEVVIVDVSPGASPRADGAFCVRPADDAVWLAEPKRGRSQAALAVLSETDDDALRMLAALFPGTRRLTVGSSTTAPRRAGPRLCVDVPLSTPESRRRTDRPVGLYVRVHPRAGGRRHEGVRSVPRYLVVLDEPAPSGERPPSDRARWLLARFPTLHVVVLESGTASVWRSRSVSHRFEVHTRMDLWLLIAGAWGMVDLTPGPLFARECVEALRYEIPVVLRKGSGADGIVAAGGALGFSETNELYECVDALSDPGVATALVRTGRALAETWYADAGSFVERLRAAALLTGPTTEPGGGTRGRSPRPRP